MMASGAGPVKLSAPTVTVTLQRLLRDGWVSIVADRSVELTEAGSRAAASVVRRVRSPTAQATAAATAGWLSNAASISPSSIRCPRTFTC